MACELLLRLMESSVDPSEVRCSGILRHDNTLIGSYEATSSYHVAITVVRNFNRGHIDLIDLVESELPLSRKFG